MEKAIIIRKIHSIELRVINLAMVMLSQSFLTVTVVVSHEHTSYIIYSTQMGKYYVRMGNQ